MAQLALISARVLDARATNYCGLGIWKVLKLKSPTYPQAPIYQFGSRHGQPEFMSSIESHHSS